MDNLKMHSVNKVDENVERIGKLFPNTLTETIKGYNEDGTPIIEQAIDFDLLKQELSNVVVEGNEERYQFTWPDKKKSILLANAPIAKTLRPCREESADFDNTQNLYIEGDNLDVLKLLQETYLNKVKIIYIDPPYNTGNDFVYEDDFAQDTDEYLSNSGQFDEEGNRLVQNTESNGRFHTDWLNMIYPRLKIAKDLISNDGVIFISIGQAEIKNLIKVCDEIFGEINQIAICSRQMKTGSNQGKHFAPNIDYILVYAKSIEDSFSFADVLNEDLIKNVYNKVQNGGPRDGQKYRTMGLFQTSLKHGGSRYSIQCPDGSWAITPEGYPWRWNEQTFLTKKNEDEVVFIETETSPLINPSTGEKSKWNIYTKIWLNDRMEAGQLPKDIILNVENRHAAKELNILGIPFDFPKPVKLIKWLLEITRQSDAIVLDFFSGSATTADAVMQLNAEDGGNRKFIMVQLPEETDEKREAYKAGYKNICEIGKERIRRAGSKIAETVYDDKYAIKMNGQTIGSFASAFEVLQSKEEQIAEIQRKLNGFDCGFRVLKVDSTNMKDVYYNPAEYTQTILDKLEDNIKDDRTSEDLLFQVMLDLGVLLSSDIKETEICGKKIFSVADNYLIACFDHNVSEEVVTEIAKLHPYYAVFRDSSIATDSVATNFEQIFQTYSPTTVRKVL